MVVNFHKVNDHLYRGGNLFPKDVLWLKEKFGINKIVSLDADVAKRIDRTTKLLGIEHMIISLDGTRKSLLKLFQYNLKKLLGTGNVFVGCIHGKDRTGLVIAMYKCKYLGMNPEKAIKEAKSFGFGVGVPPHITKLYEKIIYSCKSIKDQNSADIVSNERSYIGDNRDSFLDEGHQGSFAPYLDPTRQYPFNQVDNEINNQSPTRENYNQEITINDEVGIPNVGQYNNGAGINGSGPSINSGGFIYD